MKKQIILQIYNKYKLHLFRTNKIRQSSLKKYDTGEKHLFRFLESKKDYDEYICYEFYEYLILNSCGRNHSLRLSSYLFNALDFAIKKKLLEKIEFEKLDVTRDNRSCINYLDNQQIEKLKNLNLKGQAEDVRKIFLFMCLTGLNHVDLACFKKELIVNDMILQPREKNNNRRSIPIFKTVENILNYYNYTFPKISLHIFNINLKVIEALLNIEFRLTTRIARKTAGTYLLNKGVRIEVVSLILGHSSVTTTERCYAFLKNETVKKECEHLLNY